MNSTDRSIVGLLLAVAIAIVALMLLPAGAAAEKSGEAPLPADREPEADRAESDTQSRAQAEEHQASPSVGGGQRIQIDPSRMSIVIGGPGDAAIDDRIPARLGGGGRVPVVRSIPLVFESGYAADLDGDGNLTDGDFAQFLTSFDLGQDSADLNHDGVIDLQDLDAFANAFESRDRRDTGEFRLSGRTINMRVSVSNLSVEGSAVIEFVPAPQNK